MTIAEDFWEYRLMKNPWFSTYHGSYDYNDLMKSYDIKEFNASRVSIWGNGLLPSHRRTRGIRGATINTATRRIDVVVLTFAHVLCRRSMEHYSLMKSYTSQWCTHLLQTGKARYKCLMISGASCVFLHQMDDARKKLFDDVGCITLMCLFVEAVMMSWASQCDAFLLKTGKARL